MDNLVLQKRRIYAQWISYKIQESLPAVLGAYVFRISLDSGHTFLCGGILSRREHEKSVSGFNIACAEGTAYIRPRRIFYPKQQWAIPVLLVRKFTSSHGVQEAFPYVTFAVKDSEQHERPNSHFWLLLHESRIRLMSTHCTAGESMTELQSMFVDDARRRGDTSVHVAAQASDTINLSQLTKD